MEFSILVEKLASVWLEWMKLNEISVDNQLSFKIRRAAAKKQEELIKKRYQIINQIDELFKD